MCFILWSHSGLNQGPPDYDWLLSFIFPEMQKGFRKIEILFILWSHSGLNQGPPDYDWLLSFIFS